jgi:hypothetical protein
LLKQHHQMQLLHLAYCWVASSWRREVCSGLQFISFVSYVRYSILSHIRLSLCNSP